MPENPARYDPAPSLLDGRCILVTGAGDGIGKQAALTFARYGANVVLLGRTRQKLEAVSDAIRKDTATEPIIVPADLALLDEDSAGALCDSIAGAFGCLHGLLHNASVLGPKVPVAAYPPSEWQNVMRVNAFAPFVLTRALVGLLQAAEDASVVFTSSGVGLKGRAYWGAYAVSKFAVEGLTEVLADELEQTSNVRVNSLNPGGTRTSMRAAAYPAEDPSTLPTAADHMPLYLYLMGPDSIGVTGRKFDARAWSGPASSASSE